MTHHTATPGPVLAHHRARPPGAPPGSTPRLSSLYRELYNTGDRHTVETWSGGRLVGGLYGVALNGVFFGESMFSYERDAKQGRPSSTSAPAWSPAGCPLFDTQFVTEHLKQS